ncbi:MAG: SBBP repeat-containing protein, partial [Candidatus Kapabacteria bacterium]|nr:SBBP repeat-containing protein [Candidatus Kapabacteria bacterium]
MRIIGADMVADTVYRFIVALMTCFAALTSATDAQPVSYDDISYSMGTFFGNARNDAYLLHVAVDSAGYIYGTGLCTDIPTTTGVYQRTRTGMFDVMVFKLDPTMKRLIWATYIGGTNNDAGGSIAVNRNGEVYVTGYTYSSNFPTSVASDAAYLANNVVNYFALKLSNDGSRIMYSRILGNGVVASVQTASASKGAHLALNPQGEAFVFGHTLTPSTYSVSPAAFQRTNAGLQDLVLTKLDTTGGIVSSTFLGGVRSESAGDICYAQGKLYFSGTIASSGLSISAGKTPDAGDCFVGVFDDAPSIIPRRLYIYGSSGTDAGIAVSYDNISHRVCATGTSAAGSFPYTRILQPGMTSGGFIASLDSGLTRLNYCALIGANSVPTSIIPRKNGSVYVAGYTNGVLPITANALQSVNRGGLDGMMLCLDSIGQNVRYCTYIGGSSSDYSAAKVLLFEQSCVLRVIFGITSHSSNFPTTADSYQPLKLNGGDDQPVLALFSTVTDISASIQVKPCTREATLRVSMPCAPLDVIWNFGDGSPVRRGGVTQSYTYPRSGTFTATITLVYPDPDSVILRRVVTVDPAPQVDAGSNLIICKKNSGVRLTATGAIQYLWSPGRFLNDSTVPNPIATPPQTTTFYVRGLHNGGCVSYDSVIVQVRDIVARAERDTAVCEGVSVTLRASGA